MNKLRLLAICLLATFIMSGLVTPIGLFTASAAEHFSVDITVIASQFSYLIGGVFVGYIISFVVFDYFRMKTVIIVCYLLAFCSLSIIQFIDLYVLLPYLLVLVGICASIVTCAAGTLITRNWQGRQRQSVLVAQDAMFNGGGVVFAYVTTFFLSEGFAWSSGYMTVGGIFLFVVLLTLISAFEMGGQNDSQESLSEIKTEWNAGFIVIGISLLLFLMAKISIFIWAPQFVEQRFSVTSEQSGQFMSNIFTSAFFGSVAGTYIVSKVNVKYFLYGLVLLAVVSTWLLTQSSSVETILLLGFVFGISISATYNSYIAFGLTFVAVPTHRHIAYLSLTGGLGSAIAPMASSKVVEIFSDVTAAISFCVVSFVLVFVILIISDFLNSMNRN